MQSIYSINDIDEVFIPLVSLDDLCTLAQVNKYYNEICNNDVLMKEYTTYLIKRQCISYSNDKRVKFNNICDYGLINLAKWWKHKYNINIPSYTLHNICLRGKLEVAKWIYSIYKKDNSPCFINIEDTFIWTCEYGHLETAKWLISLGRINIHIKDNCILRTSIFNVDVEIIKWLLTLDDIDKFKYGDDNTWHRVKKWLQKID